MHPIADSLTRQLGHSGNVASVQDHGDSAQSENGQCHPSGEDDAVDCFHDVPFDWVTGLSADRINYRASMQRIKHCYVLLHLQLIHGSMGHVLVGRLGQIIPGSMGQL